MIFTSKERFEKVFKSIDNWNIPEVEKARIKKYILDYKDGEVTDERTPRPEKNLERIMEFLKVPLLHFNQDSLTLKDSDMKIFFNSLIEDKILSLKGKPIVFSSKKRIITTYKKYLEYNGVPNEVLKPLKKKIKIEKHSKEVITREELENDLIKSAGQLWQHYFFEVEFWGGLRASEFLGCEGRDIILPKDRENYVKIRIRRENTKNDDSERTVTLYGPNCLSVVQAYLEERKKEGMGPRDLVFNKSYEAVKSWLARLSNKKKRPIHFHLFRHSAATHLYNTIFYNNYKAFCEFFGWSYTSQTPSIYARRGGKNDIDEKVTGETIKEYNERVERLQAIKDLKIKELEEKNKLFERSLQILQEKVDMWESDSTFQNILSKKGGKA